jgi:hypothetical protein
MNTPSDHGEMIRDLNRAWDLELAEDITAAQLETALAEKLNSLIQSDFSALVRLLYRIDINEARLRNLLKENIGDDAGKIIARLIMERQGQKILSRRQFRESQTGKPGGQAQEGGEPGTAEWP